MMKAVFAHDHRFYADFDSFYSDGGFNDDTWRRYISVFNQVDVIGRVVRTESQGRLHKITTPNVFIHGTKQLQFNDTLMKKIIKESDVVIARLHSFIGNRAIRYARIYNKPYLIELVACPFEAYWHHGMAGKLVAPYMEFITKKLVRDAQYVIYVTENYLQKRYPTSGISTYCSNVALAEFGNDVIERRISRIKDKCKKEKVVLGTTAAVDQKYKGQQYVIEALGELKKRGVTNYEYQLVGGGDPSYLASVAQKYDVSENIKFLGLLPHEDVFNWLDTIDVYTQPSRQEGLPRALIEAMSRGIPAFGARTAGIPELLEDEFVFSNSNNNINEICKILTSYDKETMVKQATYNFNKSKEYRKEVIENRRYEFLCQLAKNK